MTWLVRQELTEHENLTKQWAFETIVDTDSFIPSSRMPPSLPSTVHSKTETEDTPCRGQDPGPARERGACWLPHKKAGWENL